MKTKILCPTDFSECSKGALKFAVDLARHSEYEIHILTVCDIPVVEVYTPSDVLTQLMKKDESLALTKLNGLKEELLQQYGVEALVHVKFGYSAEEISKSAIDLEPELIVMGTHGEARSVSRLLGSVSYETVKRVHIPVLIIPNLAAFKPLNKILIAWDRMDDIDHELSELFRITSDPSPQLTLLTVEKDAEQNEVCTVLSKEGGVCKMLMKSADPANGIAKFVSEHEVDLLAVKRHHRNFLERLLHKSVTKQVLEDVKVPMLVFNQ